jgi:hypothetical protein
MSDAANPSTGSPRPAAERRASERYPPRNAEIIWQLLGQTDQEPLAAQVCDISDRGIGLILERSVNLGSVLCLRLRPADRACPTMMVRVRHVTALGPDEYRVGGTFVVPLDEEALQAVSRAREA